MNILQPYHSGSEMYPHMRSHVKSSHWKENLAPFFIFDVTWGWLSNKLPFLNSKCIQMTKENEDSWRQNWEQTLELGFKGEKSFQEISRNPHTKLNSAILYSGFSNPLATFFLRCLKKKKVVITRSNCFPFPFSVFPVVGLKFVCFHRQRPWVPKGIFTGVIHL